MKAWVFFASLALLAVVIKALPAPDLPLEKHIGNPYIRVARRVPDGPKDLEGAESAYWGYPYAYPYWGYYLVGR